MDLDASHVEEARKNPLLKTDLFDRAQLKVGGSRLKRPRYR